MQCSEICHPEIPCRGAMVSIHLDKFRGKKSQERLGLIIMSNTSSTETARIFLELRKL